MDTVHVALKYESARGGKRTGGSILLRCLMRKFHELTVSHGNETLEVWDGEGMLTSQQPK